MLRFVTIVLSLALHAALFLPLMSFGGGAALEAGTGSDQVVVEQGIALEGLAKFGEAEEMIETVDIPPVQASDVPEPVEEIKPELTDVLTSTEGKNEEQVVAEEPKPVEEERPVAVPVEEQAPQVATLIEQSSGAAQDGGDTTQRRAYLGQVRKTLERSKVNPRSTMSGTVMIRFTVGTKGELLSRIVLQSSGSKILDDAAMAALDRAAPFPPLPQEIAGGPLEVQVPFRFVTR
ncbi:MAG: TonB family protein [Hyphomicrobium sp.]